jgi:uncharacterized membrane protein
LHCVEVTKSKQDIHVYSYYLTMICMNHGAVVTVVVWLLDLQLHMQSMPITTDVVSSNFDQGEVYNIM